MRENIIKLMQSGISAHTVALRTGIPRNTVYRLFSGESKLDNITLTVAEKLNNYYEEIENMKKSEAVINSAKEMDEFNNTLPEVAINDVVELFDVWDGQGETPEGSYSYQLTDTDWINYVFVDATEEEIAALEAKYTLDGNSNKWIKIIDIELI